MRTLIASEEGVETLHGTGPSEGDHGRGVLSGLQRELVQFYSGLPHGMKWSAEAFKHQEERGHGVRHLLRPCF